MQYVKLRRGGEPLGEYTTLQLRSMWQAGQLPRDSEYRYSNEDEWEPVLELFEKSYSDISRQHASKLIGETSAKGCCTSRKNSSEQNRAALGVLILCIFVISIIIIQELVSGTGYAPSNVDGGGLVSRPDPLRQEYEALRIQAEGVRREIELARQNGSTQADPNLTRRANLLIEKMQRVTDEKMQRDKGIGHK